jgi:hypothetical protein
MTGAFLLKRFVKVRMNGYQGVEVWISIIRIDCCRIFIEVIIVWDIAEFLQDKPRGCRRKIPESIA